MDALFTSLDGGGRLRERILSVIGEAAERAAAKRIDLHIMMFAFTDRAIADVLADAALHHPSLTVRLLADWSQRNHTRGQQAGRLAAMNLPNLRVRYKYDQPYVWDPAAGHLRWSYHASRGLLHHKTLGVLADGRPWRLICGSFNWTGAALRSYENLLVADAQHTESRRLMARVELEFEALWSDGNATLSPEEAHLHYQAIVEELSRDPDRPPAEVTGVGHGKGERLQALDPECLPWENLDNDSSTRKQPPAKSKIEIAFNSSSGAGAWHNGHARCNQEQRFLLRTPGGRTRRSPVTLTHLALDTCFRASPGETLKVAMYGLSPRVPEYGALLSAARRGVRLQLLLDGDVAGETAARIAAACATQGLPVEVRTASRMMHEKYIVNPLAVTVLTGTANLSTDASARHLEHRIRVSGQPELISRFCADFDLIWGRLAAEKSPSPVASLAM